MIFLYRNHWKHFNEETNWREDEVLRSFLENFLQAKLGSDFDSKFSLFDLYHREYHKVLREKLKIDEIDETSLSAFLQEEFGTTFDNEITPEDAEDVFFLVHEFQTLERYSHFYKEITDCDPEDPCEDPLCDPEDPLWFYIFLKTKFEITCWHPLILLLKSEYEDLGISNDSLKSILRTFESYIVRRILCNGPRVFRGEKQPRRVSREPHFLDYKEKNHKQRRVDEISGKPTR